MKSVSLATDTRRDFLGRLAVGAAVLVWRPSFAGGSNAPVCRIVRPGDADYDAARTDFNARFDIRPAAILFACSADDVAAAVRSARTDGVELRARAGRHSYEAYSLVENGLVIDVSSIAHVRVDKLRQYARFGAGVKLGDAYEQLWAADRLAIPAGSCPTVGLTGLTLGGGFGVLSRDRGLACDKLVAVEMVTADGEVVIASENEHSDLFWALRGGGGGNFGIVTELTFRVDSIGDIALTSISWPPEQLPDVLAAWPRWGADVDRRCLSTTYFARPEKRVGVSAYLDGSPDELRALIQPLLKVGTPTLDLPPYSLSWIELVRLSSGFRAPPMRMGGTPASYKFKSSSAYLYDPLSPEAIATLIENLRMGPIGSFIQCDNWGGAVREVAPAATAFFHRRAIASMQILSDWTDDSEADARIAWVNSTRVAMQPWAQGAYVNYIDSLIEDWPQQYYGENFDRLRQVKRDWDPENVFHFAQSIPPALANG